VVHGQVHSLPQFSSSNVVASVSPDRTAVLSFDVEHGLTGARYRVRDSRTGTVISTVERPPGCGPLGFVAVDRLICLYSPDGLAVSSGFLLMDLSGQPVTEVSSPNPYNPGTLLLPN
jgi:hypothetical protein